MKITQNGKEYAMSEGENGVLTLTPLIKQPEPRKPEAMDVWSDKFRDVIIGTSYNCINIQDGDHGQYVDKAIMENFTYLGKHSEVYVKISDVRDALSHKDACGDTLMSFLTGGMRPWVDVRDKTVEALRKLNIIKD